MLQYFIKMQCNIIVSCIIFSMEVFLWVVIVCGPTEFGSVSLPTLIFGSCCVLIYVFNLVSYMIYFGQTSLSNFVIVAMYV